MKHKKELKHIFIDVKLQLDDVILLEKDIVHRLKKVMRLKKGWQLAFFNGVDGLFLAEIQDNECQTIKILEKLREQKEKTNIVLFLPILKKEALSNAVRQAVELGVDVIQPVITDFTVEKDFKYDRYNLIALSAVEQSEHLRLVEIKEVKPLKQAIDEFENNIFWACERATEGLKSTAKFTINDGVLVGPEGGFSDEEKDFLESHKNISTQSLGESILKADTAIVASLFKFKMLL